MPAEWSEGLALCVEPAEVDDGVQDIDRAYRELETICSQLPDDPEDDRRLEAALADADRIAKEQFGGRWGLPDDSLPDIRTEDWLS